MLRKHFDYCDSPQPGIDGFKRGGRFVILFFLFSIFFGHTARCLICKDKAAFLQEYNLRRSDSTEHAERRAAGDEGGERPSGLQNIQLQAH